MAAQAIPTMTEADYLARERDAVHKSEFAGGIMYAMAGGSRQHSRLSVRMASELERQLQGRCQVYNSDMRVRTPSSHSYYYPDASVVCGTVRGHDDPEDVLTNPSVIVAVLSPSPFNHDHGHKFSAYREILTLQDYLMVHCDQVLIERYTRLPDNTWLLSEHRGLDASLELSVGCTLALSQIYPPEGE